MPRVLWPLHLGRPRVQVNLTLAADGWQVTRTLLPDTGAGAWRSRFELLLQDSDCRLCGGTPLGTVTLGRAYKGPHPLYRLQIQIPGLGFDQGIWVVGITAPPAGFDGNACFRFLNRFTYGNFGDPTKFGLEC